MRKPKSELDFFKQASERYKCPIAYELMTTGYNALIILYVLIFGGYVSTTLNNQWFNGMIVSGCLLWIFGPDRVKFLKDLYEARTKQKGTWLSPGVVLICFILGYLVWGTFELIKVSVVWMFWSD